MKELVVYVAAGAAYVALGVFVPEALFSWVAGAAYLLLAIWILPTLFRRLLR